VEYNLLSTCCHETLVSAAKPRPEVSDVLERPEDFEDSGCGEQGRYEAGGPARERLLLALAAAAKGGEPCPSNLELCRRAGIGRASKVTTLLGLLRGQGRIAVERTAPGRARRIGVVSLGAWTEWSRPAAGYAGAAMGAALAGRRFADVTRAEARGIARRSPRDAPLPRLGPDASPIGCALADLRGNPEFDPEPPK
jgi:hypothetical protein